METGTTVVFLLMLAYWMYRWGSKIGSHEKAIRRLAERMYDRDTDMVITETAEILNGKH